MSEDVFFVVFCFLCNVARLSVFGGIRGTKSLTYSALINIIYKSIIGKERFFNEKYRT